MTHIPKSKTKADIKSTIRRLFVSTIPICSDILIRGKKSRSVPCKENPTTILVDDSDTTITIRAKGYLSKTIRLDGGFSGDENLHIIFQ